MLKIEENQPWAVTTSDNQFQGLAGRSGLGLDYKIKKRTLNKNQINISPDKHKQGLAGRSGLGLDYKIKKRNSPDKHL